MHGPLAKPLTFPECLQSFLQRFVLPHLIPRILTQVGDEGRFAVLQGFFCSWPRGTLQSQDRAAI